MGSARAPSPATHPLRPASAGEGVLRLTCRPCFVPQPPFASCTPPHLPAPISFPRQALSHQPVRRRTSRRFARHALAASRSMFRKTPRLQPWTPRLLRPVGRAGAWPERSRGLPRVFPLVRDSRPSESARSTPVPAPCSRAPRSSKPWAVKATSQAPPGGGDTAIRAAGNTACAPHRSFCFRVARVFRGHALSWLLVVREEGAGPRNTRTTRNSRGLTRVRKGAGADANRGHLVPMAPSRRTAKVEPEPTPHNPVPRADPARTARSAPAPPSRHARRPTRRVPLDLKKKGFRRGVKSQYALDRSCRHMLSKNLCGCAHTSSATPSRIPLPGESEWLVRAAHIAVGSAA